MFDDPTKNKSYTRYVAEFAPLEFWTDDMSKRGYIPVKFQSNISYVKPIFQFGQFIVPSKTFVERFSNFIGVIVEPLNNNFNDMAWSGFTYISQLSNDFDTFYPDMKMMYFDENWNFLLNNFKNEEYFKIVYLTDKTTFEINRKKDEEFIKIKDGKNNNEVLMNNDGIKITDTFVNFIQTSEQGIVIQDKFGNSINLTESGISIEDKFGHILDLTNSGTKIDGDFISLKPFVDWLQSSAPNIGVGNLGAPVPIFPSNLAKLTAGVVPGQNFVSNKPQS